MQPCRVCRLFWNSIHIVLKVMDSIRERTGERIKKKKALEEDAAKCSQITDIFRSDAAGEL